jgi:hypothetical protein
MEQQYRVRFTGRLRHGVSPEQACHSVQQRFRLSAQQAAGLVGSGQPRLIKANLGRERAEALRDALWGAGLEAVVSSMDAQRPVPQAEATPAGQTSRPRSAAAVFADPPRSLSLQPMAGRRCPACGESRVEGGICGACGTVEDKYLAQQRARRQGALSSGGLPASAPRAGPDVAGASPGRPPKDLPGDVALDTIIDATDRNHGGGRSAGVHELRPAPIGMPGGRYGQPPRVLPRTSSTGGLIVLVLILFGGLGALVVGLALLGSLVEPDREPRRESVRAPAWERPSAAPNGQPWPLRLIELEPQRKRHHRMAATDRLHEDHALVGHVQVAGLEQQLEHRVGVGGLHQGHDHVALDPDQAAGALAAAVGAAGVVMGHREHAGVLLQQGSSAPAHGRS